MVCEDQTFLCLYIFNKIGGSRQLSNGNDQRSRCEMSIHPSNSFQQNSRNPCFERIASRKHKSVIVQAAPNGVRTKEYVTRSRQVSRRFPFSPFPEPNPDDYRNRYLQARKPSVPTKKLQCDYTQRSWQNVMMCVLCFAVAECTGVGVCCSQKSQ